MRRRRGFTLIEMMTVIGIIGTLSTVVVSYVSLARVKAEEAQMHANLRLVRSALDRCFNDTGMFPANLSDLTASTAPVSGEIPTRAARTAGNDYTHFSTGAYGANTWRGPYLHAVPIDTRSNSAMGYAYSTPACPNGQIACLVSTDTALDGTVYNTW